VRGFCETLYFRPIIFPHFRVAKLDYYSFAASKPTVKNKIIVKYMLEFVE